MEFKVCVGTEDRFNLLRDKIYEKIFKHKPFINDTCPFLVLEKTHDIYCSYNTRWFNERPEPKVTFDQAMKLLDAIEPELPFKFGDDVLVRDYPGDSWSWKKFVRFTASREFPFIAHDSYYKQITKLKGNEDIIMTNNTPSEYWIVENRELKKVEGGHGNVR